MMQADYPRENRGIGRGHMRIVPHRPILKARDARQRKLRERGQDLPGVKSLLVAFGFDVIEDRPLL